MRRIRRVAQWIFLASMIALAVLSVVGAFLGAERAKAVFNSVPMVLFWFLLALMFLAGLMAFKSLIRSPGLLAMHLGSLLILGGAMWGSDRGHAAAARFLGRERIPEGYMRVFQGEASDVVYACQDCDDDHVAGKLPFSLHLAQFGVEFYPAERTQWDLVALVPPPGGKDGEAAQQRFDWRVGEEAPMPLTGVSVKVLQYIESARPAYAGPEKPVLAVATPEGETAAIPAEVGRELVFRNPGVTVRVTGVLANLVVREDGQAREVADAGGQPENPALKVEVRTPDGATSVRHVMARFPDHNRKPGEIQMTYRFPEPDSAVADPATGLPAMQVLLAHEGRRQTEWFFPNVRDRYQWVSLGPVLGMTKAGSDEDPAAPRLYLVRPAGRVKAYKSDVVVREKGRQAARQVVEVNQPLYHGGYHFYQHSYDSRAGRYTVLAVHSDAGWDAAWIGLALLAGGAFVRCWAEPALKHALRRPANGH